MSTPKRTKAPSPKTLTSKSKPVTPLRVVARAPRRVITRSTPSPDDIARRAYEIYLGRNGAWGDPAEDWLQAERELMSPAKPRRRMAVSA